MPDVKDLDPHQVGIHAIKDVKRRVNQAPHRHVSFNSRTKAGQLRQEVNVTQQGIYESFGGVGMPLPRPFGERLKIR